MRSWCINWDEVNLFSLISQTLQISCIEFMYIIINCYFSKFKIQIYVIWFYDFNLIKIFFAKKLKNLHQTYKNNILIKNSSIIANKYIKCNEKNTT